MRATHDKYDPIRRSLQAGAALAVMRVARLSDGRAPTKIKCPRADRTEQ
jgi:hypothetical protein